MVLLHKWRCFGSMKGFHPSHPTITTNTTIFLWPSIHLNFIYTGQGGKYLSLINWSMLSYRDTEPSSQRLPIHSSPVPVRRPGPIHEPDEPFKYTSPSSSSPLFSSQHSNPVFGFTVKSWPHNITPLLNKRSDLWSHINMPLYPQKGWRYDQHPRHWKQCTADLTSPWITRSSGGRPP